ncbi:trypsin-5-like isoform X2 [Lycorma delicatula]|uniref:trypsin-5-like isoform X2 n=1 Tax=Lycorma delicatula TaxID=130591 RepID=UPI003F51153A
MIAATVLGILLLSLASAHSIPSFPFRYEEQDLTNDGSFGIINGTATDIRKHPYQAVIYWDNSFIRSGAIIDKNWILTSALSPTSVSNFTVGVGSTKLSKIVNKINVTKIVLHPEFSLGTDYWVSLLKLEKPLKFSKYIKKISIASQTPRNQSTAIVTGWGFTSSIRDEGDPLVQENKLVGSFIFYARSKYFCIDYPNCPSIFTDVTQLRSWINNVIKHE